MRLHDAKPRNTARRDGYGAYRPLESRRKPGGDTVGWAAFAGSGPVRGERGRAGRDRRVGPGHIRAGVRVAGFFSRRQLFQNLVVHDRAEVDAGSEKGGAEEQGNGSGARVGSSERIRSPRRTDRGRGAGESAKVARRAFSDTTRSVHVEGSARLVI